MAVATALAYQLLVYALLVGALFLLVSWKYGQPFWPALGWKLAFRGAIPSVLAGPALAVGVSALGVAIHTPDVGDPIREMITGRVSLTVVIVFGVLIAPFVEELFFRGFLFPLIARSAGPWVSILLTAVLFALPHGAQNEWAWQQQTVIALAGVAFGLARYWTGATSASFLMHASFNATQFLGFVPDAVVFDALIDPDMPAQLDAAFFEACAHGGRSQRAQFLLPAFFKTRGRGAQFVAQDAGMGHELGGTFRQRAQQFCVARGIVAPRDLESREMIRRSASVRFHDACGTLTSRPSLS